ncbi:hypothetical protein quinque_007486 [Culex quinquefasciatus]
MPDYEFELDACIICTENFRGRATVRLDCRHRFCADCIRQLVKLEGGSPQQAKCPLCRKSIDETRLAKGRSGSSDDDFKFLVQVVEYQCAETVDYVFSKP